MDRPIAALVHSIDSHTPHKSCANGISLHEELLDYILLGWVKLRFLTRKMKIRINAVIFLIIISLYATNSFSQDGIDIESIIEEPISYIDSWEVTANIIISMVVLVGVLGALVGIFQKLTQHWASIAVVIFGGIISVLTVIQNTAFDTDYKTLKKSVADGRKRISDIRIWAKQLNETQAENRVFLYRKIQDNIHEIFNTHQTLFVDTSHYNFFPVAYAQTDPKWLITPPDDERNIYFIGQGISRELTIAEQEARQNAIGQVVDFLFSEFQNSNDQRDPAITESIAKFLADSGQTVDTHFFFDQNIERYKFYILFRVDKKIATTDLRLFSLEKQVSIPQSYAQAIQTSSRAADDYLEDKQQTYNKIYANLVQSQDQEIVDKFDQARNLQRNGHYKEAIELLDEITSQDSEHYLAWYNLGLAHDKLNQVRLAMNAFKRAVALEPQQTARDSSLYNTFGYYLYKHGQYSLAVSMFERALKINPNHPNARRNLKAAKSKHEQLNESTLKDIPEPEKASQNSTIDSAPFVNCWLLDTDGSVYCKKSFLFCEHGWVKGDPPPKYKCGE